LPQIACFGEDHLYVSKKIMKGRTTTSVEKLDDEQKIEEISRMLGGVDVTQTTRQHAREMIDGSKISSSGNSVGRGKC
jgi:DNA repair protein RecN (Recombination protein N)